ncbi:hypothetical protein FQN57_000103 [Myotisia sp. PD_48]|nr:hypothetical protein FQN57_000103 [Myotisia sp. PD_48]
MWRYRGRENRQNVSRGPAMHPKPPSPPLGTLLATIDRGDLARISDTATASPKITACEVVASYSWLNRKKPTILIPGQPPAWTPLPDPVKLKQDRGDYFVDRNAARFPNHPMQPAIEAVFAENPAFETTSIDIVACGSTLGNLIRYIRKSDQSFRILVEIIGNTLFLVRRENSPTELIDGVYGYNHTFAEKYTTWDPEVKGTESHNRILRYSLGNFTCLVRCEADGYHPDLIDEERGKKKDRLQKCKSHLGVEDSDQILASAFEDSSIGTRIQIGHSNDTLLIKRGGKRIPQSAVFDLKTRSIYKKNKEDVLKEQLHRLWIAQIPNLVLGYHKAGEFNEIHRIDTGEKFEQWESENAEVLRQLVGLLGELISFAQVDSKLELRRVEGSDVIEIREQLEDARDTLPAELHRRWKHGSSG